MDMMELRRQIALNEPHLVATTPAGIASFSTDLIAPLKSCKVEFSPVQSGSGDPSPSNVRAISGWTGCNITRCGKNRLPITANMEIKSVNTGYNNTLPRDTTPGILYPNISANNYWLGTKTYAFVQEVQNGGLTFQSNDGAYGAGTFVPVIPQMTYKISYTDVNSKVQMRIGYYDINGYFTGTHRIIGNGEAFTAPGDVYNAIIVATPKKDYYNQLITISNLQVELGSTVTTYEPYTGSTIPIDWTTEAGTVYGGYVDLVNGEVVEEWGGVTLNSSMYPYISGTSYRGTTCTDAWFDASTYAWGYTTSYASLPAGNSCSDKLKLSNNAIWGSPDLYPWCYTLNSYNQIHCVFVNSVVGITDEDTNSEVKEKIKAWIDTNPIVIKYKLSDSKTTNYSITPTQLKTIRGINNVLSDANGDITVSYWKH
jgi:hypothetical protein